MDWFPYETLRPGQEDFTGLLESAMRRGARVVAEAPTGFGKTACALAAAIPVAEALDKKIVYLCRTHKQMDRVIEELTRISRIHQVSGISLRGRREMCLSPLVLSNTQDSSSSMYVCRLLRRMKRCTHYNNTKEQEGLARALEAQFSTGSASSLDIKAVCEQHAFCPYEIAKAVTSHARVIACSYLYLFSPASGRDSLKASAPTSPTSSSSWTRRITCQTSPSSSGRPASRCRRSRAASARRRSTGSATSCRCSSNTPGAPFP